MHTSHTTRRGFVLLSIAMIGTLAARLIALGQDATPGMQRRQDRRDDRGSRLQQRDDKAVARRDDPIGIRGPQRRTDRRDLRTDRRTDRRERIN